MPEVYFQNSVRLYPYEKLFAGSLEKKQGMVADEVDLEEELKVSYEKRIKKTSHGRYNNNRGGLDYKTKMIY